MYVSTTMTTHTNKPASEAAYQIVCEQIAEIVRDELAGLALLSNGRVSLAEDALKYFRQTFAYGGDGTPAALRVDNREFASVEIDVARGRRYVAAKHWSGGSDDPEAIAAAAMALSALATLMRRLRTYLESLGDEI
jgi:hypothetical protein